MKTPFAFSVLKYVHDIVAGEFINIGVVVYSREQQFLKCRINQNYARLSAAFLGFDSSAYKSYTKSLQSVINHHGKDLEAGWLFNSNQLRDLLRIYLPEDDSAYQFCPTRFGITENPETEMQRLFARYVTRYIRSQREGGRSDEDVWQSFKKKCPQSGLLDKLHEFTIKAPDYERQFENAWKNEQWHVAEPLSLDLLDSKAIEEKAHKWRGRLDDLNESSEPFKIHFIVGLPSNPRMKDAASRAERILKKAGDNVEIVPENATQRLIEEIRNDLNLDNRTERYQGEQE